MTVTPEQIAYCRELANERRQAWRQPKQSRSMSFLEAGSNSLVALAIGVIANYLLLPLWGLTPKLWASFQIALVYMLIAWGRNYIMRRVFARFG